MPAMGTGWGVGSMEVGNIDPDLLLAHVSFL